MTYDFKLTVDVPDEAIEWMIVWQHFMDACPKCMELANYGFFGVGAYPPILTHPRLGPVWNLDSDEPLTHPHCRCKLDLYLRVNWGAIPEIKSLSIQLGIEPLVAQMEWMNLSEIQAYREQIKGLRADMGSVRGEAREVEYIFYRVTSLLSRAGLPTQVDQAMQRLQQTILIGRQVDTMAMLLSTGTMFGAALGTVTGIGAFLTATTMLGEIGRAQQAEIARNIAREQQQLLEQVQMKLRRERY